MEAKKNPAKDVHRMSAMFFQIGLGISIAIVIVVFEWSTAIKKPRLRIQEEPPIDIVYIPVTNPTDPRPPAPVKTEIISKPTLNKIFVTEISSAVESTDQKPGIDIDSKTEVPSFIFEKDKPEAVVDFVTFPEKAAEPIGGYSAFYDLLRKNMKYPSKARHFSVEGRVFVEFIINKDGTPVDFKTIRGLGYGCDEEAIRVISLSKWNPGLQRGKPVRVKMVLPIIFQLN